MLKIRILTALVIFPSTIAAVFLPPSWLFRLIIAVVLLTGSWEFRRLSNLTKTAGAVMLTVQVLLIALMIYFWPSIKTQPLLILGAGCLTWMLMFSRLSSYREGVQPGINFRRFGFLSALGATTFCWYALSWLHDQERGPFIIFLLLLIIWASDVGAYFSGKLLGKRKLAPVISPKKTWEGVAGGILLAIAAAFLWSNGIAGLQVPAGALVALSVLTTLSSVGGDLFISMHKRTVGLKDTGTIFPGHGGVLDRYDSLLAGAPFFALAYGVIAL
ncbi:MAG: phosphatidate cytidylyltransferase [Xanthomonadales bacterium]|nr:phosphatidate cytidylyltransferase [Gammaproteobacteria bacterium]MBT8054586.1 phosphatidate cytidylyltransferase [Gammaproteobacteria bacterium]NND55618.1 phosphatidate cytidylyltransferase [Xanthomonadales bacterium]NNK50513.1 phosphatidate cytidylyltransferase [Xanthomonadales bacterium]